MEEVIIDGNRRYVSKDGSYSITFSVQRDSGALDVHYKNDSLFSEEVTVATLYGTGMTFVIPDIRCSINLITSTSIDRTDSEIKPLIATPHLQFSLDRATETLNILAPSIVLPSRNVVAASIRVYGPTRSQFLGVLRYPELGSSVTALDFTQENIQREGETAAFASNAVAEIQSVSEDGTIIVSVDVEVDARQLGFDIITIQSSLLTHARYYSKQALEKLAEHVWNPLLVSSGKQVIVTDHNVYVEDRQADSLNIELLSNDDSDELIFVQFDAPHVPVQEICV